MNLRKTSKILLGAAAVVLALVFIVKLKNGSSPIISGLWLVASILLVAITIALAPKEENAKNSTIGCGIVLVLSLMALSFVLGRTTAPVSAEHEVIAPTAIPAETTPAEARTETPNTDEPAQTPNDGEPTTTTAITGTAFEISYTNAVVYKDSIDTSWVHVVVQIENTGSDPLFLGTGSLDLEDAEEHLVKTIDMVSGYPQVIMPGETGLLVEDTMLDEDPSLDTLTVLPHVQVKKATVDCIRLETSEEELFMDNYSGLKLKGRVKNTTGESQGFVYIIVNLYDADHHGIGQLMTIVTSDIADGDKIGFELSALSMPESITEEDVVSFEVFAFPTQFQFD